MIDELIQKVTRLMREQAAAYHQLDTVTEQLSAALVRGLPEPIERLAHTGESQLHQMRSRLLQIMFTLADFSDARTRTPNPPPISPEARQAFEAASKALMEAARGYQKTGVQAASLAIGGTSFAVACIARCGFPPSTYHLPYSRRSDG